MPGSKPGLDSRPQPGHTVERVHPVELVVCLLIVLVVLVTAAQRLNVSYPIVLVIGGLVLALFPGLPEVRLEPDIVFLVFLPPRRNSGRSVLPRDKRGGQDPGESAR